MRVDPHIAAEMMNCSVRTARKQLRLQTEMQQAEAVSAEQFNRDVYQIAGEQVGLDVVYVGVSNEDDSKDISPKLSPAQRMALRRQTGKRSKRRAGATVDQYVEHQLLVKHGLAAGPSPCPTRMELVLTSPLGRRAETTPY